MDSVMCEITDVVLAFDVRYVGVRSKVRQHYGDPAVPVFDGIMWHLTAPLELLSTYNWELANDLTRIACNR